MSVGGAREGALPLFETKEAKDRVAHRLCAYSILVGVCLIWAYRLAYMPRAGEKGRWAWIGMSVSEFCFSVYWIFTQAIRWNIVYRYPFKDRLLQRYGDKLPAVDIFVCTADPIMEPPTLAMNTILSVMSYNYPTEKLSVYLSDDGGSEFTFYALLEAANFSKSWIPFCKKFKVEPRSPEAYFAHHVDTQKIGLVQEWSAMKKQYEDMKSRIEGAIGKVSISKEIRSQRKGYSEWNVNITKQDHQSIVQIIIDKRDVNAVDNDGCRLPTLVYMSREKRPQVPHNFKAGAMNALIRVSSEISNGPIILNLDCDMYANNADAVLDTLCFFMDEARGHELSYVQYPQCFNNITKNDLYGNSCAVNNKIELAGMGGYDAALYCGTGCFHRRECLCGRKFLEDYKGKLLDTDAKKNVEKTAQELEDSSKILASCSYEKGTQWGKEMGLIYGCPAEDVVTGLTIQCRGWKSFYYLPDRAGFLGVATNTLDLSLIQHKRWSEGMFQIFLSKFCPFTYGHGMISLVAQMGYCVYLLWAPLSLPTLYYLIVPPLSFLHGIPLFPQVSSLWFIPFAYVFITKNAYSLLEAMYCGLTLRAWWNLQRITTMRRTTSYLFAFIETIIKELGLSQTKFALTAKVVTEDVLKRYDQEVMEFGSSTIMFTNTATLAILNLLCLLGGINRVTEFSNLQKLASQVILCGLVVMMNVPVYQALFIRKDKGCIPFSVLFKAIVFASLACLIPII